MESNYDKQVKMARDLFLKYDQEKMIERCDVEHDENYLYLDFIGDRYRISRTSGRVECLCGSAGREECPKKTADEYVPCDNFNVVMTLYDALGYPKEKPRLAHEWCTLANLQATSSPSANIFNQKYADAFAGRTDRLLQVCKKIGGTQPQITAGADVCWQFDIFPFFPLQFRFWDRDEEFPAQIQLLWDRNALQFLHFETLYYLMGVLMNKLAAIAASEDQNTGRGLPDIRG